MTRRGLLLLPLTFALACKTPVVSETGDTQGTPFDTALDTCTVQLSNQTEVALDFVELFPTDFVGVLTEFDDVPIPVGGLAEIEAPVGEYQLKAFNIENIWFFTSFGHVCSEGGTLEIVAQQSDLKLGVVLLANGSEAALQSMTMASTDDLVWGPNLLETPLEAGGEREIPSVEGSFYWQVEDASGSLFFGSTSIQGSQSGTAYASEDSLVEPGLCVLRLTNGAPAALRYIAVHDGVGWASNDAVLDSRGPLPVGEELEILVPTGTWSLVALEVDDGPQHNLDGLVCENEASFSAVLN